MIDRKKCQACRDGASFDLPITMAFQPIVDIRTAKVFAYEALLRGADGARAAEVFSEVTEANLYAFDQKCRVTAIELANDLNLAQQASFLSINFLPNAVYDPRACIRLTLETAKQTGFPVERIMFEFTEGQRLDSEHLLGIVRTYRDLGFKTGIDDFGAGFAGLELLSQFQPDVVKLDMALIRDIGQSPVKRTIIQHTLNMLNDLDIITVCEGIETLAEFEVLRDLGVNLMQGNLFAEPGFKTLPKPVWPDQTTSPASSS